ncbi:MAG: FkbM family methyltransferase [Verrucomicrobiota bacterium]
MSANDPAHSAEPAPSWLVAALECAGGVFQSAPLSLVDVGASNAPPRNQKNLASIATYLGFDPDLRLPQAGNAFGFVRHTIVNKAIAAKSVDSVTFNLTRYPECSSTLLPNPAETDRYAIADFFDVVGQASVGAMTLEQAVATAGLSHVDWLKLDTQGTDYDILTSLSPARLAQLLVVDVEPGVVPFYTGENTVAQIHAKMLELGFWLADLNQQRFPRLSRDAVKALQLGAKDIAMLPGNPFALELQYCRSIESLEKQGRPLRDFLALWILAMANGHTAFSIDVALAARRRGLAPQHSDRLVTLALDAARQQTTPPQRSFARRAFDAVTPPLLARACRKIAHSLAG